MKLVAALFGGAVFGAGLVISGMTEPGNVIAFLNIAPGWNAALIIVMASALVVTFIGYRLLAGRAVPLFDDSFHTPTKQHLDPRLLSGAVVFGVGWGVSGYCPGPAIVGTFLLDERALIFMVGYLVGVGIYELADRRLTAPPLADG
jgi:uncharacterized membrane protein YedE/YeeE